MKQTELLKFGLCLLCAIAGILLHLWAGRQREEILTRRRLIVGAMAGKSVLFVAILALQLPFVNPVDPTLHYLPETRELLQGKLPYRDFASVYSPLFTLLLAVPVAAWDSVAVVSMVMIAGEAVMLAVYLLDSPASLRRWRAATLYVLSPISLYWVGIGYHSGLVATGTVIALVCLHRGRDFGGGIAGAVTLLFTKLTAIVAWPALLLFDRSPRMGWRLAGFSSAVLVMGALAAAGLDVLMPVKLEVFRASPGNVPNILRTLFPALKEAPFMTVLPFVLLLTLWLPAAVIVLRSRGKKNDSGLDRRFDATAAFIAYSYLVFMIASRKAYTFYGPTFLLFVIHAFVTDDRRVRWLGAIALLGATTTIEIAVASEYLVNGREMFRFPSAALDTILVATYAWLAWGILKQLRSSPVENFSFQATAVEPKSASSP